MSNKSFSTKEEAADFLVEEYSLLLEEAYNAVFEEAYETVDGRFHLPLSRFVKKA